MTPINRRHARPRLTRLEVLSLLATAVLVAGCAGPAASAPAGGSATPVPVATATPIPTLEATNEAAEEAPAGALTIMLGPGPYFVPDDLTAPAGTVVFFLDARQADEGVIHNMVIASAVGDAPLAKSDNLEPGQSGTFTVHGLEPGMYEFWCTFTGHLEAGMRGILTIT